MCEAVTIFRQALAEEGLDGEVAHESDGLNDSFYFSKTVAGEPVTYTYQMSETTLTTEDSIEKEIAMAARRIAERYKRDFTDRFEWNDRAVEVVAYDEPEARCMRCGATADLPDVRPIFRQAAELSSPQPVPVERETRLESLDDHSRVMLKMYLIGILRRECESHCPNAVDNSEATYGA